MISSSSRSSSSIMLLLYIDIDIYIYICVCLHTHMYMYVYVRELAPALHHHAPEVHPVPAGHGEAVEETPHPAILIIPMMTEKKNII